MFLTLLLLSLSFLKEKTFRLENESNFTHDIITYIFFNCKIKVFKCITLFILNKFLSFLELLELTIFIIQKIYFYI